MADNCALPKISGRLNLPFQAFAFPEIVPSAPIMMGIIIIIIIIIIITIIIIIIIIIIVIWLSSLTLYNH